MKVERKRIYGKVSDVFYYVWDSLKPEHGNTIFVSSRGENRASVVRGVAFSYWKPQGAIFGPEGQRFGMVDYDRYSQTTATDTTTIAHAIRQKRLNERVPVPVLIGNLEELLEFALIKPLPFSDMQLTIATDEQYLDKIKDFELLWVEKDDYMAKNYAIRVKNYYNSRDDIFILSYTDPNAPKNARETFYWLELKGEEIKEATGMSANAFALNVQSSGLQWALEQLLEPLPVREARKKRIPFVRQGDLYFIETNKSTRYLKNRAIIYWKRIKKGKDWHGRTIYDYEAIIDPDETGKEPKTFIPQKPDDYQFRMNLMEALNLLGNHYPREVIILDEPELPIYVRGSVIHQNGDHKTINLGNKWHLVVQECFHDKVQKYVIGIRGSSVAD